MPGSGESEPTDRAGSFWCHHVGTHPTISSLQAAEFTVTWHTNVTSGLWSAFASTKFEGVQRTSNFVLCPLLINPIILFFKASALEFPDNYSKLSQFFFCVWLGWFLPHKLICVYWYWLSAMASLPGYSLSSFPNFSHSGLDQKIWENF